VVKIGLKKKFTGDHSQKYLAKFGYMSKNFYYYYFISNLALYWQHIKTYEDINNGKLKSGFLF